MPGHGVVLGVAVVLAASGLVAAVTKLLIPGAWYIALGGIAGVGVAALFAEPGVEADGP